MIALTRMFNQGKVLNGNYGAHVKCMTKLVWMWLPWRLTPVMLNLLRSCTCAAYASQGRSVPSVWNSAQNVVALAISSSTPARCHRRSVLSNQGLTRKGGPRQLLLTHAPRAAEKRLLIAIEMQQGTTCALLIPLYLGTRRGYGQKGAGASPVRWTALGLRCSSFQ